MTEREAFIAIPGLGTQDVAAVQSLLASAGFFFHVLPGFPECEEAIVIRAGDKVAVQEFLRDYRVRSPADALIPIPW